MPIYSTGAALCVGDSGSGMAQRTAPATAWQQSTGIASGRIAGVFASRGFAARDSAATPRAESGQLSPSTRASGAWQGSGKLGEGPAGGRRGRIRPRKSGPFSLRRDSCVAIGRVAPPAERCGVWRTEMENNSFSNIIEGGFSGNDTPLNPFQGFNQD